MPSTGGVRNVAGRRVHVRRQQGAGPTVVLCSALGGICTDWDAVIALLPSADVVVFDRPGLGHSPPPSPAWPHARPATLADEVRLIADVCEAVGAPPPYVLVGHSSGGLHAQAFARTHPDQAAALVLVDSDPPRTTPPRRSDALRTAVTRVPLPGAVGPLVRRVLVWAHTHHGREPLSRAERRVVYRSPAVMRTILAELDGFDEVAWELFRLSSAPLPCIPITVLAAGRRGHPWRRRHPSAVREQRDLARLVRADMYRELDDAAHMIVLDRPDAVAEEVLAALRRVHDGC